MFPSATLSVLLSALTLLTSVAAQNNVAYGYVGYTCSSPDFTVFEDPGECLAITNPPTGHQSASALFYQSGCEGFAYLTSDCTGSSTAVPAGGACIPAPAGESFFSYGLVCNSTESK